MLAGPPEVLLAAGYQHVDDLVQRCEGTVQSITTWLPEAAGYIPRGFSDLGLAVSTGDTMIAGHLAAAKAVAAELRAMGYVIGAHKDVEDLGISLALRGFRTSKLHTKKVELGLAMCHKVKKFSFTHHAKKLVKAGARHATGRRSAGPPGRLPRQGRLWPRSCQEENLAVASAAAVTLLELSWTRLDAHRWLDKEGLEWAPVSGTSSSDIR
jgi:hypothetical protein